MVGAMTEGEIYKIEVEAKAGFFTEAPEVLALVGELRHWKSNHDEVVGKKKRLTKMYGEMCEENTKLLGRNKRQRELIEADPVAQLAAVNKLLQEPLECGHPLDALYEESEKCLWCEEVKRLSEVLMALSNGGRGDCWCTGKLSRPCKYKPCVQACAILNPAEPAKDPT